MSVSSVLSAALPHSTQPTPPSATQTTQQIAQDIARMLHVRPEQVNATIALLDGGATVPFVARYRKEVTGGLDDIQLRELAFQLDYMRELHARLAAVLASVAEQGKLTPALQVALKACATKQALEDLYAPFKPKRRTKGMIAREAGIEPLADLLWGNPGLDPQSEAAAYVLTAKTEAGDDFTTAALVLDGVRDLLCERWAELPSLVQNLREWLWTDGSLSSKLAEGKSPDVPDHAKFKDYFDYAEPIGRIPSHRALAVFRGRALGILDARLVFPVELNAPAAPQTAEAKPGVKTPAVSLAEGRIAHHLQWSHSQRPSDDLIRKAIAWTWKVKLVLSLERDLFTRLREAAESVAIKVFADNLRDLLLAAPAGPRVVMGLDPGIRTGVKVAVVDATGKLVDTATVFPHEPRRDWHGALHTLQRLANKHGVSLIAIGNGTASRETDQLAAELIAMLGEPTQLPASGAGSAGGRGAALQAKPVKVVVSEAGASVYSASEYASQEMPDVDVSLRGAASIARRLQDPLAELVKIDPKSIGVGQYQHDLNQAALARSLNAVVEDCVNAVGVDLNTASSPLLGRVSGLSSTVAQAVVRHRDANGAFKTRQDLLHVTGLGAKTFEQCAGFLRIQGGSNPLDVTGVHPESYPLVESLLQGLKLPLAQVLGQRDVLRAVHAAQYVSAQHGLPTVQDVLQELEKPGRDPRPDFKVAQLKAGVNSIGDLVVGMRLEGTVTNVAAFGAFVDLGVHQDGLVHVSQLSHTFTTDARSVVKTGDIVRVQVVEVDIARKRIALTMKLGETSHSPSRSAPKRPGSPQPAAQSAMASAFAKLVR